MKFSDIHIIYNPQSKGSGKQLARQLQRDLFTTYHLSSHLHATSHAGHGKELAEALAKKATTPLIVSVSGDGGYHDVVNGVLIAQTRGTKPVCAVLPAGNANDHARVVHPSELSSSIANGAVRQIDMLKMTIITDAASQEIYAHSYIGFGLSPAIAVELNKTNLNIFKEIYIVGRNILGNRSFTILHSNKHISLDSLVFSNIGEMAKILKLSKNALPDDGLFEVTIFPHRGKTHLLRRLWRTTRGVEPAKHLKTFQFTLAKATVSQLDGEVLYLQAGTVVKIDAEHKVLSTLA